MRRFLAIPMILALVLLAACGSDDDNGDDPTAASGDGTPTGVVTAGPPPEVDPGMELQTFEGTVRPYTIEYPVGWTADESGPSFDLFEQKIEGTRATQASMQIYCTQALGSNSGGDPKALVREDADLLRIALANISDDGTMETKIDGREAVRWKYQTNLGAGQPRAHQWVYYVADDLCAWRIRMIVYGLDPVVGWEDLFDRMAQTFHSTASTPPDSGT